MAFNRARFLIDLLGPGGARALAKASDRSESLGNALIPRTIVAWLRSVDAYEGHIPGSDCQISFQKSEHGFGGQVQLQGGFYSFTNASLVHVAGAVSVAIGLSGSNVGQDARRLDLERLGKSIDQMVKAEASKKVSAGQGRTEESSSGDEHGETGRQEILQNDDKSLRKKALNAGGGAGGGTGTTAGPVAPAAPTAPTASAPKPTTTQSLPKPAGSAKPPAAGLTAKLTRSEITHECPACGRVQFNGPEFVGCSCFRALAKSVTITSFDADTADLKFGDGWDKASVVTLLESVGRK